MSLKVRLISCISAFIIVLSMLFIGVYAAQSVELNVGGSVSFTASSVYADITGSYVGTVEHPSTAEDLTPIHITADTTDGAVSMPSDWTNMPLNFDESGSPITVTITIQNLASDRAIAVSLTDNTSITGVNVARTYNSSSFSDNTSSQTINGGGMGTFTFTLTVTNQNNDISGDFDVDLDLSNKEQEAGPIVNLQVDYLFSSPMSLVGVSINGEDMEFISNSTTLSYSSVDSIQFGIRYYNEMGGVDTHLKISGGIEDRLVTHNEIVKSEVFNVTKDMVIQLEVELKPSVSQISDLEYNITDEGTVELNVRGGPYTILRIPAFIEGYDVVGISNWDYELISGHINGIVVEFNPVYGDGSGLISSLIAPEELYLLDISWCSYLTDDGIDISRCKGLTDVYLGMGILRSAYENGSSNFLSNLRTLCEDYIALNGTAEDFTLYVNEFNLAYAEFDIDSILAEYGFIQTDYVELNYDNYYFNYDSLDLETYPETEYVYVYKYQG